jgi:AcrR family transcriptional regulator
MSNKVKFTMRADNNNNKIIDIIHAAQTVIAKYGYKKTTMDDIAQFLNISRTALYYYYKNKEEIFSAVIDFELELYKTETVKILESRNTTIKKLSEFVSDNLFLGDRFRNIYKFGEDDIRGNYTFFKGIRSNIMSVQCELLGKILKQDNIIVKHHDIDTVSKVLIKSMHGIRFFSAGCGVDEIKLYLFNFCSIIYNGLVHINKRAASKKY